MSNAGTTTSTPDFDPDALREKYRVERDKRIRKDANSQYVEVAGPFADYLRDPYTEPIDRPRLRDDVTVAIIGGGFAGLITGARLRQAGIDDVRIIEKGGDFGGTWYWNRYPGAQCDVESYVYLPLLEETSYVPSEKYARAPEILEHCQRIARHFDLYERALLSTEVTAIEWDSDRLRWTITTNRGDRMSARFLVMGNGPLHRPKLPGIPGHWGVRRPLLSHQPVGLRLYRRRLERRTGRPGRQACGHHRHRGDRRAGRSTRCRVGWCALRLPAHTLLH